MQAVSMIADQMSLSTELLTHEQNRPLPMPFLHVFAKFQLGSVHALINRVNDQNMQSNCSECQCQYGDPKPMKKRPRKHSTA